LARALAVEPKVLLMDEPLSNLDARLREEVRDEIKTLAKKFGIAVLLRDPRPGRSQALADRVAVMSKVSTAVRSATDLYDTPQVVRFVSF
jgi:ABC-type Fe3+/spermidine/putrescine transport system ATPase subunit